MGAALAGPERVRTRPEALDAPWLEAALWTADLLAADGRVRSIDVAPVGTGQMADTFRLAVEYEPVGAGPATLIAKFPSREPQSRETGRLMRAYEAEVHFYAEVAPLVRARIPDLVAAAFDPADASFTLVLSDLGDAVQGDQLDGCSPDRAEAAIGQLAGLHAPCWESTALAALPWLNRRSEAGNELTTAIVTGVLPGFLERYDGQLAPEHVQLLEAFIPYLGRWMARAHATSTVVHGDYRLDNLLFTPGDPTPVVVDFQTVAWGSGAYDLAYFVGGCLTPEIRRSVEADLVDAYHGRLIALGVANYGRTQLDEEYRREAFGGLVMAVGASMMVRRTERGDAMFLCSATRHAQHALDLDALATLE